jgi:hypothetical protein
VVKGKVVRRHRGMPVCRTSEDVVWIHGFAIHVAVKVALPDKLIELPLLRLQVVSVRSLSHFAKYHGCHPTIKDDNHIVGFDDAGTQTHLTLRGHKSSSVMRNAARHRKVQHRRSLTFEILVWVMSIFVPIVVGHHAMECSGQLRAGFLLRSLACLRQAKLTGPHGVVTRKHPGEGHKQRFPVFLWMRRDCSREKLI